MHHQKLTFSNKNYSKYCLLRFKMFHSTFPTVKILLQTTFKRTNVCATSVFPTRNAYFNFISTWKIVSSPYWLCQQSPEYTTWIVSLFGVFLVRIFPHSDWVRRVTEYLSVFNPNVGKYKPERLLIRTLFTQW